MELGGILFRKEKNRSNNITYPEKGGRSDLGTNGGGREASRGGRPCFECGSLDSREGGGFVDARNVEYGGDSADRTGNR